MDAWRGDAGAEPHELRLAHQRRQDRVPTLVLLGEFDNFEKRREAFEGLAMEKKAFVKVACGSHYLQYEKNRKVVHEASKEWLLHGTVAGKQQGHLAADAEGRITEQQASAR